MLFYQLSKEKLIYGPNQIEAMINQNTTISQQLTLWDQRGSRVIRGRLIVTPIENSFLYIVPLYLQAEGANFPQLKRVIAVAGEKVVMEATLDEALNALFGTQQPLEGSSQPLYPAAGVGAGENAARGGPEGNAAGGLGKIWNGDGGSRAPAGRAGGVVRFGTTLCRLAERLSATERATLRGGRRIANRLWAAHGGDRGFKSPQR
jgi:uncharacterized membrane protein (UPF0182 family)